MACRSGLGSCSCYVVEDEINFQIKWRWPEGGGAMSVEVLDLINARTASYQEFIDWGLELAALERQQGVYKNLTQEQYDTAIAFSTGDTANTVGVWKGIAKLNMRLSDLSDITVLIRQNQEGTYPFLGGGGDADRYVSAIMALRHKDLIPQVVPERQYFAQALRLVPTFDPTAVDADGFKVALSLGTFGFESGTIYFYPLLTGGFYYYKELTDSGDSINAIVKQNRQLAVPPGTEVIVKGKLRRGLQA